MFAKLTCWAIQLDHNKNSVLNKHYNMRDDFIIKEIRHFTLRNTVAIKH